MINLDETFEYIATALTHKGYCILPQVLPEAITLSLAQRVITLTDEQFSAAGIGRNNKHHLNKSIRNDETYWLTDEDKFDKQYLDWMEQLRIEINQRLYMGLFKFEAHYAHYSEGAFYQRHLDAFKGKSNRVLSTLLYLNKEWQESDAGELILYDTEDTILETILPSYGKFVVFLSDRFPHEVIKANRDRYSIAGWFHIRG
ncbi:2OG-Fe(II) oxygenase [Pseudomonadota bacterium]|nr:2OG-Fe(II) oxygenase [Pseudomonadota bacterium]